MEKTYKEALADAKRILMDANIAEADLDAWYLLEHMSSISKVEYYLNPNKVLDNEVYHRYLACVRVRSTHVPLQHIIGTQEFMGYQFQVNEHVLIPRQDTECLVEEVMKVANHKSILDVCTGSGCIILSLSKLCSLTNAVGVDISNEALLVANANARELDADVTFIESDLFEEIHTTFDVIVSNPPYIRTIEIETLMEEVKDHEPLLALDGKEDGLYFYKRIIKESPRYLSSRGYLFFEIGYDQGEAVAKLMMEHGFTNVRIKQDMAGLDRIVLGQRVE